MIIIILKDPVWILSIDIKDDLYIDNEHYSFDHMNNLNNNIAFFFNIQHDFNAYTMSIFETAYQCVTMHLLVVDK